VKVFAREFELQNIPSACSVGISKEVSFTSQINPQQVMKNENLSISWTCGENCENFFLNSSENSEITAKFSSEGNFVFKSTAKLNGVTKSSTTDVTVNAKVIPHVVMKFTPSQPINTLVRNEFVATVVDLVPRCTAQWALKSGESILEKLPDWGSIAIRDYEEHFLNEIVDYDNNTLSKDVPLRIPAKSLKNDEKYKFRLNIICPEPIVGGKKTADDRKNVTTFYDIVVTTNGPPTALDLDIFPTSGIPMRQNFKFSTGAAKDRQDDYPLRYSFSYKIDELLINVGTFYENQVTHTQLPYADNIETFLEVNFHFFNQIFVKLLN
jgi:hypothetical protein